MSEALRTRSRCLICCSLPAQLSRRVSLVNECLGRCQGLLAWEVDSHQRGGRSRDVLDVGCFSAAIFGLVSLVPRVTGSRSTAESSIST